MRTAGFCSAADGDEPHARDLGDLLRQPCIGVILDLREGQAF